jgi:homogentisate 1,2-dioxygenase
MALIVKRGSLPRTPHTEFYFLKGQLALEEIHGVYGFSGAWSRKLHVRRYPTEQVAPPERADFDLKPQLPTEAPLQPYHLRAGRIAYAGDFTRSRLPLVAGATTTVSISKPNRSSAPDEFFRNGDAHELIFVQEGEGELLSEYGRLPFRPRQYLVVPKGTTTQWRLKSRKAFFLVIESAFPIHFPPHYANAQGQSTLMSPVVETEIGLPELPAPLDKTGKYSIYVKHDGGRVTRLTLGHHPFDVCGWEGSLYPFSFDSADHHSIAREIHTAPPARQTFQAGQAPHNGFAICTFRSQVEGWHPKDVPAPYAHQNVDCAEVMFFSNTTYGAREGLIEPGSMTVHPGALPHSPQGDAAKRSLKTRGKISDYLAVMLDTFFEPLHVTRQGLACADESYALSWKR